MTGRMHDLLQWQPDTKQVAVVFGASPVEPAPPRTRSKTVANAIAGRSRIHACPPGASFLLREPGFWEKYQCPIAGVLGTVFLQSGLVVGLWVNRNRRILANYHPHLSEG